MDKRKKYFMVVDVETTNGFKKPLVYDVGFAICDKKGHIFEKHSYIVDEIFNNKSLMSTAYYKEKVPRYLKGIEEGVFTVKSFTEIRDILNDCIERWNVTVISAYNLNFDANALGTTAKHLLKINKFLTHRVEMLDIWSFACEVLFRQRTFHKVAVEEEWVSEAGNLRTSAEIAHRYITGTHEFEEEHTGLEDVLIEVEILAKCFAQNKKHISGIIPHPWRLAQTSY